MFKTVKWTASIVPSVALLSASLFSAVLLSGCVPSSAAPVSIALPASIGVGKGLPEDINANGSTAFVSSFSDGSILKLDLNAGGVASSFASAATDAYTSGWGLRVVPGKNWLLAIANQPYDFNPVHAKAGRVTAYDLTSAAKVKSWDLPAETVGNSVDVDPAGNIYVGDIGPNPRVVKIDPVTGVVKIWASSDLWVKGGFGVGGMVYGGKGLYGSHNNLLWYIGVNADGSAAAPQAVKVDGDPVIFADGMTWTENGIIYAENDVLVAGSHGVVYRLDFKDPTTATRTVVQQDMTDPSGVTVSVVNGKSYLLVNESQLGYAFGVDKGQPSTPYQVRVFPR